MFVDRLKKIQNLMKSRGIGIVFLHPGVNMYYFTGIMRSSMERLLTVIIPGEGDPLAVVPEFEVETMAKGSKVKLKEIRGWKENEDPYALVRKVVEELAGSRSVIGVDGKMEYIFFDGIQKALPDARFVEALSIFSELRLIKSKDEVELIKKAAHMVCKSTKAAFESVSPGRTEEEVAAVLHSEIRRQGGVSPGHGGVLSGFVSALPHGQSSKKRIEHGEVVLMDVVAQYEWYVGDITRCGVVGEPTERQKKIYEVVLEAQKTACEAVRTGMEAQELDAVARRIIGKAGFARYFTHRLGHGIGLEVHEAPYIVEGNTLKLQPGMVHSIEPGIYLQGEFGIRIEDDVVVTSAGCENLSVDAFPKDQLLVL